MPARKNERIFKKQNGRFFTDELSQKILDEIYQKNRMDFKGIIGLSQQIFEVLFSHLFVFLLQASFLLLFLNACFFAF